MTILVLQQPPYGVGYAARMPPSREDSWVASASPLLPSSPVFYGQERTSTQNFSQIPTGTGSRQWGPSTSVPPETGPLDTNLVNRILRPIIVCGEHEPFRDFLKRIQPSLNEDTPQWQAHGLPRNLERNFE